MDTKTVFNFDEMVKYQENSIVSRMVAAKPQGTVTLFSFGKGEGLSEHSAPYDALIFILDGKTKVTISGIEYHLQKDEMIVMPANEPHAVYAEENFKMLLVMIKG